MTIRLVPDPTVPPMEWHRFADRAVSPPCSIALDGYVHGAPRFTEDGPFANFNHHEDVNRLATRATCGQVLIAIRQGLFKFFRVNGEPEATVFVNDCDEDVCTSWFLLKNHAWCEQPMNPLLNRLVTIEDALDATAGAYPFPADLPVLREVAWVFQPYRQFRLNGGLDQKDASAYRSIIEDVESRILRHITGSGGELPLDTRYARLGGGKGWALVKEIGAQARTGMFADGIQAFISWRPRPDGRNAYVVGRMSPFIPFNCRSIFAACNSVDNILEEQWGGSDTIGGSPRVKGSKISPGEMERIVTDCLGKRSAV